MPPPELNEGQRRSLSVGLHQIAGLLAEVEGTLTAARNPSPFSRLASDISPAEAGVIRDYLAAIRRRLAAAADRHDLDICGLELDARRSILARTTGAWIAIEESRSRRLRGYGALDPSLAEEIDRTCDELERAVREMERFVLSPQQDFEARLRRLGETTIDADLLGRLERVIREEGLVEFRRAFEALLERIEERTFHVAVFGRVSSGKSSLLNTLLGQELLPVGVTPVTAVPTRVRLGRPPGLSVRFANGQTVSVPIEDLRLFATEDENPENVKKVSRLDVVTPSRDLPDGIELVDTPGIGSLATSGAQEALAYLPRTDAALVLVDASSSIGSDEVSLLRLFQDAAIPAEVLLSKADLVDDEEREKLRDYVSRTLARELGRAVPVHAVSTVKKGLVAVWSRERLKPLFDRRTELLEESIRRMAGRLAEGVAAALHVRLGRMPAVARAAAVEEVRRADERIAAAREAAQREAERLEASWGDILVAATKEAVARFRDGEAGPLAGEQLVREAAETSSARLRKSVLSTMNELQAALSSSARNVDAGSAELFAANRASSDVAGLPILDFSGLTSRSLRRPFFLGLFPSWAARRLLATLRDAFEREERETLHSFGYRMRDFALRAVEALAAAYHGAVGPFVHGAEGPRTGRAAPDRLAEDLAYFESVRGGPPRSAAIKEEDP